MLVAFLERYTLIYLLLLTSNTLILQRGVEEYYNLVLVKRSQNMYQFMRLT